MKQDWNCNSTITPSLTDDRSMQGMHDRLVSVHELLSLAIASDEPCLCQKTAPRCCQPVERSEPCIKQPHIRSNPINLGRRRRQNWQEVLVDRARAHVEGVGNFSQREKLVTSTRRLILRRSRMSYSVIFYSCSLAPCLDDRNEYVVRRFMRQMCTRVKDMHERKRKRK